MNEKMSLLLTSCGRLDLLNRTLESFFEFNNFPLEALYLTEDSADPHVYAKIRHRWGKRLKILFNKKKFRANTKNFHSPANSMINAVLESKKGNPITLCTIYLLIAQKLDIPIYGVNLPNLFILTFKNEATHFYINAFNKGLIFSKDDIDHYLEHLNIPPQDLFYEPCSHEDIIHRCLRNLVVSFEKLGDYHKSDEIKIILKKLDDKYTGFD